MQTIQYIHVTLYGKLSIQFPQRFQTINSVFGWLSIIIWLSICSDSLWNMFGACCDRITHSLLIAWIQVSIFFLFLYDFRFHFHTIPCIWLHQTLAWVFVLVFNIQCNTLFINTYSYDCSVAFASASSLSFSWCCAFCHKIIFSKPILFLNISYILQYNEYKVPSSRFSTFTDGLSFVVLHFACVFANHFRFIRQTVTIQSVLKCHVSCVETTIAYSNAHYLHSKHIFLFVYIIFCCSVSFLNITDGTHSPNAIKLTVCVT